MTDKTLLALALLAAVAAAAVATAGCGDRSPVWSERASVDAPTASTAAVAIVDAPADRVVLLVPGADQSLRIEHVPVGRHILNVAAVAATANKLLRPVGRPSRDHRRRRARREAVADRHRARRRRPPRSATSSTR